MQNVKTLEAFIKEGLAACAGIDETGKIYRAEDLYQWLERLTRGEKAHAPTPLASEGSVKATIDATDFEHFEDFLKVLWTLRAIQCGEYRENLKSSVQKALEVLLATKAPTGERIDPLWWLMHKKLVKRSERGTLVTGKDKIELTVRT